MERRAARVLARVAAPKRQIAVREDAKDGEHAATPEELAMMKAWSDQESLVRKVRSIAEDAKTYEQDTGVHCLSIGFPLLSLPPGSVARQRSARGRRILAPLAFIPVTVAVKGGVTPAIELECKAHGLDLVAPNESLLAWLEQQTGKPAEGLFADEGGDDPWREISELTAHAAKLLGLAMPDVFSAVRDHHESFVLDPAPRGDAEDEYASIVISAVLGLFPMANQGLLRDMKAMAAGADLAGPVESFVRVDASIGDQEQGKRIDRIEKSPRVFADERLVSTADPCQSHAVKLSRQCTGLVVHGPPGTGKSQTITNIIGDHLARGERVLFVCDKRTALDVVADRLEHLGLAQLCATVHDPKRDQRELYRSIREQLEGLPDARSNSRALVRLIKVDSELQRLHRELTDYCGALSSCDSEHVSFHELVGNWLGITLPDGDAVADCDMSQVSAAEFESRMGEIKDVLDHGVRGDYARSPWVESAGIKLTDFLATPMECLRQSLDECVKAAERADAARDESIPAFGAEHDWRQQGAARGELAPKVARAHEIAGSDVRSHWAGKPIDAIRKARQELTHASGLIGIFRAGPLDAELMSTAREKLPKSSAIAADLASLAEYLQISTKWYAFLKFGVRKRAAAISNRYGLLLSAENAERVHAFLQALRARMLLTSLHFTLMAGTQSVSLLADEELDHALASHQVVLELFACVAESALTSDLLPHVAQALRDPATAQRLARGLEQSQARGDAMADLAAALAATKLFNAKWVTTFQSKLADSGPSAGAISGFAHTLHRLESVIRVREGLSTFPKGLAAAAESLVTRSIPSDRGLTAIRKAVLAAEIMRRLRSKPELQSVDGQRIKSSFDRYRALDDEKRELVRDAILHFWISRQKERMLASTASRLNSEGAEVKRRLLLRGERALRLRQVIAFGQDVPDGDPLFDLRPVWMASPETVAQVFSRKPLFDVVIFDEASQCRLEEALPVLTRAKRVVIAGDPMQLPPTRFFESAVATSDEEEIATDQDLFEVQQSDVEDLLAAALNLDVQQCYLDVHYRSRNAALIEFSNQHFYESRLQPIPAHPSNRTRFAPISLIRVDGIYEDRCNAKEADAVCGIVRDLLKRAEPPSIGIACFNVTQRDLILDRLEALAMADSGFARRLADARERRGYGSFQGLFVKNLENVQGDERDHIIISTTYGPDPKGKFFQRFGPLGREGGGRRLNVLVTRAREEVHLVTSIPPNAYRNLPAVPAGRRPGGAWLLYAYLRYAEWLREAYDAAQAEVPAQTDTRNSAVRVADSAFPSQFAVALANQLATKHCVGSDVHWGNDGFCVDIALAHPKYAGDVTIGLLCDGCRFGQAADPVEWDMFRTMVLESQGWKIHRLWTPHFFRDVQGSVQSILRDAQAHLEAEQPRDAIPVVRTE